MSRHLARRSFWLGSLLVLGVVAVAWGQTAPVPGLAVWSLHHHPTEPDVMLAGYEPCAIHRSTDDGRSWQALPVEVTFPDVTLLPMPSPKRVTGLAVDPNRPSDIYASVEVGGLLRSTDDGASWRCVTDGLYVNDDAVDLHRVAVSPGHPGTVNIIGRIGLFRSADRGERWRHLPVPSLTDRQPYCRDLMVAPDDPDTLYVAIGSAFDGDCGALFQSRDDGANWRRLELGAVPGSTVFGLAIDRRRPTNVYCTSRRGEVFAFVLLLPRLAGQLGFFPGVGDAAFVDPAEDLAGMKPLVTALAEGGFKRLTLEIGEVDSRNPLSLLCLSSAGGRVKMPLVR